MVRRRLDPDLHGSGGYTSIARLAVFGMAAGAVVLGAHLASQAVFADRMLPGTVIAGRQVGWLSTAEARALLQKDVSSYRLKLDVAGQPYELKAADIGVRYDVESTLAAAYETGREHWLPPFHVEPSELTYHLDRTRLNAFVASVAERVGTPPVDAGVVVRAGKIETVPEKSGWSIDKVGLVRLIESDLSSPAKDVVRLKAHEQVADIQAKALSTTMDEAKQLMAVPVVLQYSDRTFAPTPAQIGQWLAFVKQPDGLQFKLVAQVDTAKLKNYVQSIANDIDVSPVNKLVNVENGVSKVTREGVDGLAIDQDGATSAVAAAVMAQKPLNYTITAKAVPFKTISTNLVSLDLGRYIEVNLSKQRLWVWQDHQVIYESPVTTGATGAGLGTVTGLFSIYYKTTNTHLVGYQYGYNYNVAVKYWMPFYSGYGLHDASWRNGNFGGQDYYYGGSHGCVNMPDATAEFVYNWASVGTPVWVHK